MNDNVANLCLCGLGAVVVLIGGQILSHWAMTEDQTHHALAEQLLAKCQLPPCSYRRILVSEHITGYACICPLTRGDE